MRQRYVYPTSQIAHKWAHQTQESARNPQGNFFFEGPIIYSYRHNWPVAQIFTNKKRIVKELVLINSDRYSVTTAGHTNDAYHAVSHKDRVTVPNVLLHSIPSEIHKQNLAYIVKEIASKYERSKKVMLSRKLQYLREEITDLTEQANIYSTFFGLRKKFTLPDFQPCIDRVIRIETPDPVRDARRYKAKIAREALKERNKIANEKELVERNKEAIVKWRAHDFNSYSLPYYGIPTMLRISPNGNEVQTSRGATVPLDHAKKLYDTILKVIARQERYEHNGHSHHVGDFRVDTIEINGDIRVGCHNISFEEITLLAKQLNWYQEETCNQVQP